MPWRIKPDYGWQERERRRDPDTHQYTLGAAKIEEQAMDSEKWPRPWDNDRERRRMEGAAEGGPPEVGLRGGQTETDFQTDIRMALASCFAAILAAPARRQAKAAWGAIRSLLEARYAEDGEGER